ncbi:protein mono-ADP-ribosyltransferase PARP12-like isoform X2 [Lissotriton helveticus]
MMWEETPDSQPADDEPFMSDPAVSAFLTQQLCARGGRLAVSEIPQHLPLPPAHIASILREEASRFLLLEPAGLVLALSAVRLCINYQREQCQTAACGRLHLCRFFILGKCFHRSKGNSCSFSHDIQSEVNKAVLKAHKISSLDEQELQVLLLLNDSTFLPEVCMEYKGEQKVGSCTSGAQCNKLHICGFFVRGQCVYANCSRSHNLLAPNNSRLLQARGISKEMSQNIHLMRTHQCKQAQREGRKNNTRDARSPREGAATEGMPLPRSRRHALGAGHSCSMTDLNMSSQKSCNPRLPLWEPPFHQLYPLNAPSALFPKTGHTNRFPQAQNAVVQVPVGHSYLTMPSGSAHRNPTRTTPPITSHITVGPPATSKAALIQKLATTPLNMVPPTGNPMVQVPLVALQAHNYPPQAVTPTKLSVPVGLSPACTATFTQEQMTTPLIGSPYRNTSEAQLPAARVFYFHPPEESQRHPTMKTQSTNSHVSVAPLATTAIATQQAAITPFIETLQINKSAVQVPASNILCTAMPRVYSGKTSCPAALPPSKATNTAASRNLLEFSMPVSLCIQPTAPSNDSQLQLPVTASASHEPGHPEEICLSHIWKFCKNLNNCAQVHFYLPYRWQILEETGEWKDLPSMEDIEKAYSDPNNGSSKHHNIDFQKMTSSLKNVRRLSTTSSVTKPRDYVLTTVWIWYWKDECGQWSQYGKYVGMEKASVTSEDLENIYLADRKTVLEFEAGSQKYEINFQDMTQRNLFYGTKKAVLRRPRFVSQEDVKKLRDGGKTNQMTSATHSIPDYWDTSAQPSTDHQLVEVQRCSSEFQEIEREFAKTLPEFSVQQIKRIQNPSLWQAYQLKRKTMKTLNRDMDVLEKKLFHGTKNSDVATICCENFDYRNLGRIGNVYGKGSYFSRDASYSHQYCHSITEKKSMFLARVLVGDFVKGHSSYLSPPAKPTNPRESYDSCVDNERNPSIYVIFDKHQIYPEYVLEYTELKKKGSQEAKCTIS